MSERKQQIDSKIVLDDGVKSETIQKVPTKYSTVTKHVWSWKYTVHPSAQTKGLGDLLYH